MREVTKLNVQVMEGLVAKLELQVGDVVVVKLRDGLDPDQLVEMRMGLEGMFPEGTKILLLDNSAAISVISSPEPESGLIKLH
jgi:hypothetical protein